MKRISCRPPHQLFSMAFMLFGYVGHYDGHGGSHPYGPHDAVVAHEVPVGDFGKLAGSDLTGPSPHTPRLFRKGIYGVSDQSCSPEASHLVVRLVQPPPCLFHLVPDQPASEKSASAPSPALESACPFARPLTRNHAYWFRFCVLAESSLLSLVQPRRLENVRKPFDAIVGGAKL